MDEDRVKKKKEKKRKEVKKRYNSTLICFSCSKDLERPRCRLQDVFPHFDRAI